ncbi:MAG TPA: lipopolysaccharide biosynthesis protein, partial [Bacteroidales bacterium]|nr:lipopolysaccharide biosynthesis protein [Bacteroidales bacterium]
GLKQKAVSGMFWSFSDSIVTNLVQFIVGLILARLLSPSEFGLIGMIAVFLAISQSLVDSSFSLALIRKKEASDIDFSTAFYFNIAAGLFFFMVLYLCAPYISSFYNQPELTEITRAVSLTIIINALGITQITRQIRNVNFRLIMKLNITGVIISGSVGIILALKGYGVWSLVWRSITGSAIQTILYWVFSRWVPYFRFSKTSFRELFSFGSKLLLSGLIDTIYKNIYLLVIGKFFSAAQLGYYTRAEQFTKVASQNLTISIQRVSYPILSMVQEDDERLKSGYRKLIQSTMFIAFFLLLGLAAMARPLILTLIGEQWLPCVEYLQLLCFAAMLYPLQELNLNVLNVKGRTDLVLRLEVVKKTLAVPVIALGVLLGIRALLLGMIGLSVVSSFINAFYSGRMIGYTIRQQLSDLIPSFILSAFVSAFVFMLSCIPGVHYALLLLIQIFVLMILVIVTGKTLQINGYIELRNIISGKLPWLKEIL